MKPFSTVRAPRRSPVVRDRYRSVARHSGVAPRLALERPPAVLTALVLGMALWFVSEASPRLGGVLAAGADDFGARLGELFPALQGNKPIELPTGGGTVSASIVATLPDFTRDPQMKISGRIPGFAQGDGRIVDVTLNGALLTRLVPDASGAFTANVDLRDGPNAIALAFADGQDILANASYTVVLDRQPPALGLTTPTAGAQIEGPTITVSGRTEPGATITIDGRTIVIAQDGAFTDRFTATPGALTITTVARDRAGNETTVKTPITVRAPAQTIPVAVSVTLDSVRVKPGTVVTARIFVTANGIPKADEQVTLSVGVITIGSARTNSVGMAVIGFAAPPNEGEASVVVLASGGASGRVTLTVAK
jgi:hypothetical protein